MVDNAVDIMNLYHEWQKGNIPFDPILEYYTPRIRELAYKYARVKKYNKKIVYDFEDWLSHGYYACYDSCLRYDENNKANASLDSYVYGRLLLEFNGILDRRKYKKYDDSEFIFVPLDKPSSTLTGTNIASEGDRSVHEVIPDSEGLNPFNLVELEDLCEYYSFGDNILAQTFKEVVLQDKTLSESARSLGLGVGALHNRVTRNRVKLQKVGVL